MSGSNLLPIESLTREPRARQGFELAAPNPILGKTVFLRLPVSSEWSYEVDAAHLRVERDLILRDQMWVTRGTARFAAVHTSGARCEVTLKVRPWRPRGGSKVTPAEGASARVTDKPADERILPRALLAPRARRLLKNSPTVSFRGDKGDEESRSSFSFRARFLAALGMTRFRTVFQQPARRQFGASLARRPQIFC